MSKKFHIEERIWSGVKRRKVMSELRKDELIGFLQAWTRFNWECLDDKELWEKENHEQAYQQIKALIENQPEVDEAKLDELADKLGRRMTKIPVSMRQLAEFVLQEAGVKIKGK